MIISKLLWRDKLISSYDAAIHYINNHKWYLVPIPHGTKGPSNEGWNKPENTIHTVDDAKYWENNPNENMGLLHAPSGTMSFDIDDVEKTKFVLEQLGLDYESLLKGAPRIKGSPGHDKAIFRMPDGVILEVKKLSWEKENDPSSRDTIFEFRGGYVQDVLPPSIHPDTKKPYEWVVESGQSEIPIIPDALLTIWVEWDKFRPQLLDMCPWATKRFIPPIKKESKKLISDDNDIIGQFNRATPIDKLMEGYGYIKKSGGKYLSPYSKKGIAGVVIFKDTNRLYSHHASEPFDTSYSHDAFDMFCFFEHKENTIEAIKAAAKKLGVKTEWEKGIEHGKNILESFKQGEMEQAEADNIYAKKAMDRSSKNCKLPSFPGTKHPIFKKWMDLGSELSYSREPFHFFNLLTINSMALGRVVNVRLGDIRLYSNLYCMLIGTSSISGKSFSTSMAINRFFPVITSASCGINKMNEIKHASDKLTEPKLVQKLHDNYQMFWEYDECQKFFKEVEKFNASILPQMCKIYDGNGVSSGVSRNRKGEENHDWFCVNPFMSCLFSMTIDQFDKIANSDLIDGGFIPRWMFVVEEGGEVKRNVSMTPEQEADIEKIRDKISNVTTKLRLMSENSISFNVCNKIEDWKINETNRYSGPDGKNQRIAIQRAFGIAYKLAMIFSLFDEKFQKKVLDQPSYPIYIDLPDEWVDEALKITDKYLMPRTVYVLDKSQEENTKNIVSKFIKAIKGGGVGWMERGKIMEKTRLLSEEMDKAVKALEESDEIEVVMQLNPGAKRKSTIYCLKNNSLLDKSGEG